MTLRRVRTFRVPGDPVVANELATQLAKFEENVQQETADVRAAYMARLKLVATEQQASDLRIAPGESASVDTSLANVSVTLTVPTQADAGKFTALMVTDATNVLTVLVPDGVTINRTTSVTAAAVGLLLIFCDGVEYWT